MPASWRARAAEGSFLPLFVLARVRGLTATGRPPNEQTPARPARLASIDWLRGLAVVFMILAHVYDAWLLPSAKTGAGYEIIRHLSGLPSRLFLFLVGVSTAIGYEKHIALGRAAGIIRAQTLKRGLMVIALAYVFRV